MSKTLAYNLSFLELQASLTKLGYPSYRAKQVWDGLYRQLWANFEEFTNLPLTMRNELSEAFLISSLSSRISLNSKDEQTTKTLFDLGDSNQIETVLMRYENRSTVCVSSQAGCALGCTFCATGQMGLRRNLGIGEIVEQVIHFARIAQSEGQPLTNVVLMGMGEPFHNYDAVLGAIDRLNDPTGFNMGARRFTISTVGLIPGIKRFTKENRQIGLAISLHAADDKLRSEMLPVNDRYPIKDLMLACKNYLENVGRRITFEWALIDGVNDSEQQAHKLAKLIQEMSVHVNVIPLNPTKGFSGQRSTHHRVSAFRDVLQSYGISCTVRVRRGIDIMAGCGQLAESELDQETIQISN
jgi:23S rRNA (adenine2503-C2)-methyltransferase